MPSEDLAGRALQEIVARVLAHVQRLRAGMVEGPARPVLVGLDGRSGSGKTRLAGQLSGAVTAAGLTSTTVHLDDLYPGWSGLAAALGPLCSDVVAPLTEGRPGVYTSWDWHRDTTGPRRVVPATDVVLLEGVGVLASGCADHLDLRLWLEAPEGVRRDRALARDGEVFAPHWDGWAAQEEQVFRGDRPPADAVVDALSGAVTGTLAGTATDTASDTVAGTASDTGADGPRWDRLAR